jgi:cell division protein ZapA (FtsZ GTPase activity inhibitor)
LETGVVERQFDVNVAGYTITVKTSRSPEHVDRITSMVNERVREIRKSGGTTNYLNIVLLASMSLADEVLTLRENREGDKKAIEERQKSLLGLIDGVLEK